MTYVQDIDSRTLSRFVQGQDMGKAFARLYEDVILDATDDEELQQGRRLYLNAVKEAFRQLLKVGFELS